MKKLILTVCALFIFVGCNNATKQPEVAVKKVVEETPVVETVEYIEPVKKIKKKAKKKEVKGTYYRMVTKSIEVFAYKGSLRYVKVIDDKKLRNSFYLKGNLMRIEKVYNSKIGDKYGKIANKNLLVSMDDLTTYKK